MKIAVDAMGGDLSPQVNVAGAVMAAKEGVSEIILVGDKEKIEKELADFDITNLPITIKHTEQMIHMHESPVIACKQKKDSSIMLCARMVAQGEADAFVTAGSSGAAMTASLLNIKRLKKISRPAIAVVVPRLDGRTLLIDAGANVDSKPNHLLQFAIMGSVYLNRVYGINNPKIGLLNIGEEESKGNELTLQAFNLLKESSLNFVGNVEGRDILSSKADVVVCDGFVGNVVLKLAEGVASYFFSFLKKEIMSSIIRKIGLLLLKNSFSALKKKINYDEYGGAQLLGIDGTGIICHGSSNAKAIKNAIKVAFQCVKQNINTEICEALAGFYDDDNNKELDKKNVGQ